MNENNRPKCDKLNERFKPPKLKVATVSGAICMKNNTAAVIREPANKISLKIPEILLAKYVSTAPPSNIPNVMCIIFISFLIYGLT
jgi:hypothetical protein